MKLRTLTFKIERRKKAR